MVLLRILLHWLVRDWMIELLTWFSSFRYFICSISITTFSTSWLGPWVDFFIRKNCSSTNDLRAVNSVSNGTWLLQGVVGTETLFSIPMTLDGVLKVTVFRVSSSSVSNNILLVETLWFSRFKIIDFNTHF